MTIYRRRKLRIEEEPATTRELPPWNVPEKAKDGRTAEIKRALGQTGLDAVVKEALDSIEEPVKPKGPRATAAVTGAPKIAGIIERFKGLDRLPKGAAIDVGLDVGSRGIKCVVIAEVAGKNEIVFGSYAYHEGKTYRTAAELLEHVLDTSGVDAPNANAILRSITFTGSAGAGVHSALSAILNKSFDGLPGGRRSNFNVQYHREVPAQTLPFRPHFKPDRRPTVIIGIGGNDAKFIYCDEKGAYKSDRLNAKCAAGTGTFLEENCQKLDTVRSTRWPTRRSPISRNMTGSRPSSRSRDAAP